MGSHNKRFIEPVYTEIGNRIRWAREARSMSMQDLADRIDISSSTVSQWERGLTRLSVSEVVVIADVLQVPLLVLLDDLKVAECKRSPEARAFALKQAARMRAARAQEKKRKG